MATKDPSLFDLNAYDERNRSSTETIPSEAPSSNRRQQQLRTLKLTQLEPAPDHPRKVITEEAIATLAAQIRERGVQQPIVVWRLMNQRSYMIIDGVIRFRAAQRCGLDDIPAHVVECEDRRLVRLLLDLTHKDLHPVDLAEHLEAVAEGWKGREKNLADMLGRQQSEISRSRRIATLSEPVKAAMRQQEISFSVAHELADDAFTDRDRLDLLAKNPGALTTHRLRAEIRRRQPKPASGPAIAAAEAQLRAVRRLETWLRRNGEPGDPNDLTLRDIAQRLESVIHGSSNTPS